MNDLKKIFFLTNKKEKYKLAAISGLNFFGIFLEMLSFALIIPVFNIIFLDEKSEIPMLNLMHSHFLNLNINLDDEIYKISILLILILIFFSKNIFLIIINYVSIKFYNLFQLRLSNSLFKLYLKQDYSFFLDSKSDFLVRKLINDTMGVKTYLNLFQNAIIDILLVIAFSIVLILVNYQIFLFCAFLFIIIFFIYFKIIKKRIVSWSYNYQHNLGTLQNLIISGATGIKDIAVYNLKDFFQNNYKTFNNNTFLSFFKIDFINNIQRFWMEIVAISAMILPLIIFLYIKKDVNELIPIFALFLVGLFKIIPTFNRLVQCYQILKFNKPSLEVIYQQFYELKNYKDKDIDFDFEKNLKFVNIGYTYKNNNHEVFKNVNVEFKKNKSVAIIGKNGSGKSTLLNLLTGLIKPTTGDIFIDETKNLSETNSNWLKKISYVQQNIFLLNDSIKNNITFENNNELNYKNYSYVKEFVDLDEAFSNLSNGLNTIVGNDGLNLSGGQKQLISIARALYKNSDIIVFDEANSALDFYYKDILKKTIQKLKGTKTIIFVTHDLSFLKNSFDEVYLIDSGQISLR